MTDTRSLPARPFTLTDAARLGISASAVQRLAKRGEIERIAHGLYARTDAAVYDIELVTARLRASQATLCLTSALAHHGLVDAIPARSDLALPRGHWQPTGLVSVRWHAFDAATFDVGRTTTCLTGTRRSIGIYTAERSIVDAFRLRSTVGYELAIEALKSWLRRRGSAPADLITLARQLPRAEAPVRRALEYLT